LYRRHGGRLVDDITDRRVTTANNLRRAHPGFTLIELMMVMVVVAVLAVIAVPNLRSMIATQRVKSATTDLHTDLTLARSEAIKRNAAVDVVPVNTANWALGWSVKFGTTTLFSQQAPADVTLTGPAGNVSYLGTGRMSGTAVSFFIKAANYPAVTARCIFIDPSGRPSVRLDKDGDSSDGVCD
jgi:type IV fimbrial biogenesis protein FimT